MESWAKTRGTNKRKPTLAKAMITKIHLRSPKAANAISTIPMHTKVLVVPRTGMSTKAGRKVPTKLPRVEIMEIFPETVPASSTCTKTIFTVKGTIMPSKNRGKTKKKATATKDPIRTTSAKLEKLRVMIAKNGPETNGMTRAHAPVKKIKEK